MNDNEECGGVCNYYEGKSNKGENDFLMGKCKLMRLARQCDDNTASPCGRCSAFRLLKRFKDGPGAPATGRSSNYTG